MHVLGFNLIIDSDTWPQQSTSCASCILYIILDITIFSSTYVILHIVGCIQELCGLFDISLDTGYDLFRNTSTLNSRAEHG